MFFYYARPYRISHSGFPSVAPACLDHFFSTIHPVFAYQYPSDQLLPLPHLQSSSLYLVAGFFFALRRLLRASFDCRTVWTSDSIKVILCIIAFVPLVSDLRALRIDSGELL
jgi:hypothetical protein